MQGLLTEEKRTDISTAFEREAKYLTFELCGEEYGLDVLKVKEIISMVKITPVPKTPKYVRGIINLRGKVIPVIDLRMKLGVRDTESSKEMCIIIIETHSDLKGIIVDMVSEVLVVRGEDMEPSPQFKSGIDTNYFLGIAKIKGRLKLLLNIDNVLGTGSPKPFSENKKELFNANNEDKYPEKNDSLIPETSKTENISPAEPEGDICLEVSKANENVKNEGFSTEVTQTDDALNITTVTGEIIETAKTGTEDTSDLNTAEENIAFDAGRITYEESNDEIRADFSGATEDILQVDVGVKENVDNENSSKEEKQMESVLNIATDTGEIIDPGRMDKEEVVDLNVVAETISNDIKEATTSLFETMIMMEMKFKEYSLVDETKIKSDVVSMISFTGKYHGIVSLFCSKELALQIASNMLMETQTIVTTEVKDAVGEILNMIAGNVKTKIAERYGETYLSIPLVIVGEDISVSVTETPYKTTVVCFTKDPWITTKFIYNNEIMTVGLLFKKTVR